MSVKKLTLLALFTTISLAVYAIESAVLLWFPFRALNWDLRTLSL